MKINEKEAGDGSFFKKIATTKIVLLQQGHFFNIAQKNQIFGHFLLINCHRRLFKITQSGHTECDC